MDVDFILNKIECILKPVISGLGYDLIERELFPQKGKVVLRLYIDKAGGVTIGDCEAVSRAVEGVLDVEGIIDFPYNLEVSSPGVERPVRRAEDFLRFVGEKVNIKVKHPIAGRSRYTGTICGVKHDRVVIRTDQEEVCIPLDNLAKARLRARF